MRLQADGGGIVTARIAFNAAVRNENPNPSVKLVVTSFGEFVFQGSGRQRVTLIGKRSDESLSVIFAGTVASSLRNPIDTDSLLDFDLVLAATTKRHTHASRVDHVLRDASECAVYYPRNM